MKLYLDDCADADLLADLLRRAGNEVYTPRTERLLGARDPVHLEHAVIRKLVLITKNSKDFRALHFQYLATGRRHYGILLIHEYKVRSKNLAPFEIVAAIDNLERSGIPIVNEVHNLNHWR
jgi:predicted nuclease of predicted toxin-antitoxin system